MNIEIRGLKELERKLQSMEQQLRGVETRVGNNTVYGPLVGSKMFQTRVHKQTGWPTDEQVLTEELPAIQKDLQEAVDEALSKPAVKENPLLPPMRRAGFRLQARMANYPRARPGSSYRRTGTYGRRWVVRTEEK